MAGQWTKLVGEGQIGAVTNSFVNSVAGSFAADNGPQTQNEIKRRFNLCCEIFENLRGDLLWAVDRALDYIPRYLRCELDGEPYDPVSDSKRTLWNPQQGDPLR